MTSVSDRHDDDLDGRLLPVGERQPVAVEVTVEPGTAEQVAAQHTASLLVNLLARLEGVVNSIEVRCPGGVSLAGRIAPLAPAARELRDAMLTIVEAIGVVPLGRGADPLRIVVGPGPAPAGGLRVYGCGWQGAISRCALELPDRSELPIGPYVAACLAAGEVFRLVCIPRCVPVSSLYYSAWSYQVASDPLGEPAVLTLEGIELDCLLAGAGAVGAAWLHTIWASDGLRGVVPVADSDPEGVDLTNLNRGTIYGQRSLGHRKASEAEAVLTGSPVRFVAHDGPAEELERRGILVSAVDTNRSRDALQGLYPSHALAAATRELRLEVLRCGAPGIGPCLRCHNPPEAGVPDVALRRRLANADTVTRLEIAREAGATLEQVAAWVRDAGCGGVFDTILDRTRARLGDEPPRMFAVGFLSALAGVLLAGETIKESISADAPLGSRLQRATFQFFDPTATANRASVYLRQPDCPRCAPESIEVQIWAKRYAAGARR